MTNSFLKKQFFALTLLAAALMAPIGFAQDRGALDQTAHGSSIQASAQDNAEKQKRFEASPFIRTELYFGRNKPGGGEVSRKEFDGFLSGFVTERFPDGLTVLKGR